MNPQIVIIISALIFLFLILDFQEIGGMNFPLLKILLEMILLLYLLVLYLHKDLLMEKPMHDKEQTYIEDYFQTLK